MVRIWTMDNGKRLEIIVFRTNRHLTKIQRQGRKNKHISCRMLGQLLTLIDLFILANYPVSYKVVNVLQTCSKNIFETCMNRTLIIDRMRKTRKHCVLARDLIWRFCMNEEVCLLLYMEGSFLASAR